jgi:hypothetical protein
MSWRDMDSRVKFFESARTQNLVQNLRIGFWFSLLHCSSWKTCHTKQKYWLLVRFLSWRRWKATYRRETRLRWESKMCLRPFRQHRSCFEAPAKVSTQQEKKTNLVSKRPRFSASILFVLCAEHVLSRRVSILHLPETEIYKIHKNPRPLAYRFMESVHQLVPWQLAWRRRNAAVVVACWYAHE